MSIHYHGTPLTPRHMLERMAGAHFCVSFANPGDVDVCMRIGQSVQFDNGAYPLFTRGGAAVEDWSPYYKWLEPKLGPPHWAVVPDHIGGDEDQQRQLVAQWPFPKALGAPVWHMHLPLSYLVELASVWPRVCIGSSREFWQIGTPAWCNRMTEAFVALHQAGLGHVWIHGLRMMAILGDPRWPLASGDSVNVARNFKDSGIDPAAMAKRIDAANSPSKFIMPKHTLTLETHGLFTCSE